MTYKNTNSTRPVSRSTTDEKPLCDGRLEQSALGSATASEIAAEILIRDGRVEFFTSSFFRDIFTAICELGPKLDVSLLLSQLESSGRFVDFIALSHLQDGVLIEESGATNDPRQIKRLARLHELSKLRALSGLGDLLSSAPYEVGAKSSDIVADVQKRLEALA